MNFAHCLHIVLAIRKYTDVFGVFFSGSGGVESIEGVKWEDISMEDIITGEENFHEGGAGFSCTI